MITTYDQLKTEIAAWTHRTDLTAKIIEFVALAEETISRDLSTLPVMWTDTSTTTLVANDTSFTLPVGALGLRSARIVEPYTEPISIVTADEYRDTDLSADDTGPPSRLYVIGSSDAGVLTVQIYPKSDGAYTLQLVYPSRLTALSDTQTTNTVLSRAPSMYLFAALHEVFAYLRNEQKALFFAAKYQQAMRSFKRLSLGGRVKLRTEFPLEDTFNITTG